MENKEIEKFKDVERDIRYMGRHGKKTTGNLWNFGNDFKASFVEG
jgi:hypothetical protein